MGLKLDLNGSRVGLKSRPQVLVEIEVGYKLECETTGSELQAKWMRAESQV